MTQSSRSYTTIHVAKRLGVSLQTVQRWVDAGHLRAWKTPGGHRRIEATSAEALFKSHEEGVGLAPANGTHGAAAVRSVVIVDDDPGARLLLETLVRQALPDAQIVSANNGFQGLIVIGRLAPDVVITDIQMPHMNGLELLRSLTVDEASRPRLLIAVTALRADELRRVGELPAGVQLFSKPVDQARFSAALAALA
jgi:excisionase family DNA binding protein